MKIIKFIKKLFKKNNSCIEPIQTSDHCQDSILVPFNPVRLIQSNNNYSVTDKIPFSSQHSLKPGTVSTVFDFAYKMSFTTAGAHRDHRSGGRHFRKNGEIFANTFQGKLAECAACNLFYKYDNNVKPDFSTSALGSWDSVDLTVLKKEISVKSTKSYGQLLLLEKKDWNSEGEYIPNINGGVSVYDCILLVRIKPSCDEILKKNRLLYCDNIDRQLLFQIITAENWQYDYVGYITRNDLKTLIDQDFCIPKGALLNGKTSMDADNYYIQAGSMRRIDTLEAVFNDT